MNASLNDVMGSVLMGALVAFVLALIVLVVHVVRLVRLMRKRAPALIDHVERSLTEIQTLVAQIDAAVGEVRGLVPEVSVTLANLHSMITEMRGVVSRQSRNLDYGLQRATKVVDDVATITTVAKIGTVLGAIGASIWAGFKIIKSFF